MVDEVLKCHDHVDPPAHEICEPICPKIDIENGTYGSVTIVDGCIVDAQECHLPVYTPPVCCGGDSGGDGGTVTELNLLPDSCNLLNKTGGEYYVKPVFTNTSTVSWSGCGTSASPFSATVSASQSVTISGGACINAQYAGGQWNISHQDGALAAGTYDGITLDACGHVTEIDIDDPQELAPKGGSSITIVGNEISIAPSPAQGVYQLGGTTITVDAEGRVTNISNTPIAAGSFTTVDGKTVTYDTTGVITSVV